MLAGRYRGVYQRKASVAPISGQMFEEIAYLAITATEAFGQCGLLGVGIA